MSRTQIYCKSILCQLKMKKPKSKQFSFYVTNQKRLNISILVCEDCQIGWGSWGECADGYRNRSELIIINPVGAGEPCPTLRLDTEECVHCVTEWSPWSDCALGERTRYQRVVIDPVGDGGRSCLFLPNQTERKFYIFVLFHKITKICLLLAFALST